MKILQRRLEYTSRTQPGTLKLRDVLGEGVSNDNLAHADYVLMRADHQRHDLPQARDWEAILLFVELELLERDDVACRPLSSTEDDAVGAFLDVVEALVLEDGSARLEGRVGLAEGGEARSCGRRWARRSGAGSIADW